MPTATKAPPRKTREELMGRKLIKCPHCGELLMDLDRNDKVDLFCIPARKREERKDRLHRNYIRRRDNGKQKEYEERTKAAKKEWMDAKKNALRAEDIAKGVFVPVSALPKKEPKIAEQKSADLPMAANQ